MRPAGMLRRVRPNGRTARTGYARVDPGARGGQARAPDPLGSGRCRRTPPCGARGGQARAPDSLHGRPSMPGTIAGRPALSALKCRQKRWRPPSPTSTGRGVPQVSEGQGGAGRPTSPTPCPPCATSASCEPRQPARGKSDVPACLIEAVQHAYGKRELCGACIALCSHSRFVQSYNILRLNAPKGENIAACRLFAVKLSTCRLFTPTSFQSALFISPPCAAQVGAVIEQHLGAARE